MYDSWPILVGFGHVSLSFPFEKRFVDVRIACQVWSPGVVNDPDAVVQKTDSLAKVLQLSVSGLMWWGDVRGGSKNLEPKIKLVMDGNLVFICVSWLVFGRFYLFRTWSVFCRREFCCYSGQMGLIENLVLQAAWSKIKEDMCSRKRCGAFKKGTSFPQQSWMIALFWGSATWTCVGWFPHPLTVERSFVRFVFNVGLASSPKDPLLVGWGRSKTCWYSLEIDDDGTKGCPDMCQTMPNHHSLYNRNKDTQPIFEGQHRWRWTERERDLFFFAKTNMIFSSSMADTAV